MENVLICMFILSFTVVGTVSKPSEVSTFTCETLTSVYCQGLGYNYTAAKWLGIENQDEASFRMQTLLSMFGSKCHHGLTMLLCTAYLPLCVVNQDVPVVIGPCRDMCQAVRDSCQPQLRLQGMAWPKELNCSRFLGGRNALCVELPATATPTTSATTGRVTVANIVTSTPLDMTTPLDTTVSSDTTVASASPSTHGGATAPAEGTSTPSPPRGSTRVYPSSATTSRGRYEMYGIVTGRPQPSKSYKVKFSNCQCSCTGVTEIQP